MVMRSDEPTDLEAPSSPGQRSRDLLRTGARSLGIVLLLFVAWVVVRALADPYGYLSFDPMMMFALGLVAAGVLLLRGQQPAVDDGDRSAAVVKERSPLGVITLSAAFLVVGMMILVGNLGLAEVTLGQLAAAALTVVGIGVLVGARWGHSSLLMVLGVVLVPFVIAGGFLHFPLRGAVGDHWIDARSIDDVASSHEVLIGTVQMNLADLRDFAGSREIDISLAAGNATIFVPERMGLTVNGHIEWGNATIGRGRQEGDDLVFNDTIAGDEGTGHLTINFSGGIASLYVERISQRELHGPRHVQRQRENRRGSDERQDSRQQRDGGERRRDRAET